MAVMNKAKQAEKIIQSFVVRDILWYGRRMVHKRGTKTLKFKFKLAETVVGHSLPSQMTALFHGNVSRHVRPHRANRFISGIKHGTSLDSSSDDGDVTNECDRRELA